MGAVKHVMIMAAMNDYEEGVRQLRIQLECQLITRMEYTQMRIAMANQVRETFGAPPFPEPQAGPWELGDRPTPEQQFAARVATDRQEEDGRLAYMVITPRAMGVLDQQAKIIHELGRIGRDALRPIFNSGLVLNLTGDVTIFFTHPEMDKGSTPLNGALVYDAKLIASAAARDMNALLRKRAGWLMDVVEGAVIATEPWAHEQPNAARAASPDTNE